MPSCVGQRLQMRSAESALARPKATANSKTQIFAQQQQESQASVGTPTQCISNSQTELFHPAEDPSYFQECHFFELYEAAEREISFQTSIINQSWYRNPLDQNSRLIRYYRASHKFSTVRKTLARHRKVRRLKCDVGSWVLAISLTGTRCGTGTL